MTLRLALHCDHRYGLEHTACAARFHRTGHTPHDLTTAARQAGWRVDPDGDLCPNHARSSERMSA